MTQPNKQYLDFFLIKRNSGGATTWLGRAATWARRRELHKILILMMKFV